MAPSPRTLSYVCAGINLTISLSTLACLAGVLISSTIISAILPQFIYDLFKVILEAPGTVSAIYILLSLLSVGFSLLQLFATWTEQCRLVMICLVYHLVSLLLMVKGTCGIVIRTHASWDVWGCQL